ncbi:substrate-binding domain-containing protein [uncultured Desulfuromonas sp.]|uniref:substrate-binding domain-containing protein n=1 Tax=uncultured Desulfuromonas sp. TaxID=181013 RepID=UPI00374D0924
MVLLCVLMSVPVEADSGGKSVSGKTPKSVWELTRDWPLPPPGPPGLADKVIVYIGEDLRNGGILGVGVGVREAAQNIGWKVSFFDIGANDTQRETILRRALKLQPDGVILGSMDAVKNARFLTLFDTANISVVGWHVAPNPGPVKNSPIRWNVATNSAEVAKVAANYVIEDSDGKAGVVIFTDSRFAIATKKTRGMAEIIRACEKCQLLEVIDLPLNRACEMMPEVTQELIQKYGDKWQYSLAINDLYFDYATPTLVINNRPPEGPPVNISAGDGSPSALLRIRYASYQQATIPEPLILQGWQLVDELNRIMQGDSPSGYQYPPIVITEKNIWPQGDRAYLFDPENGYRQAYRKIWKKDE